MKDSQAESAQKHPSEALTDQKQVVLDTRERVSLATGGDNELYACSSPTSDCLTIDEESKGVDVSYDLTYQGSRPKDSDSTKQGLLATNNDGSQADKSKSPITTNSASTKAKSSSSHSSGSTGERSGFSPPPQLLSIATIHPIPKRLIKTATTVSVTTMETRAREMSYGPPAPPTVQSALDYNTIAGNRIAVAQIATGQLPVMLAGPTTYGLGKQNIEMIPNNIHSNLIPTQSMDRLPNHRSSDIDLEACPPIIDTSELDDRSAMLKLQSKFNQYKKNLKSLYDLSTQKQKEREFIHRKIQKVMYNLNHVRNLCKVRLAGRRVHPRPHKLPGNHRQQQREEETSATIDLTESPPAAKKPYSEDIPERPNTGAQVVNDSTDDINSATNQPTDLRTKRKRHSSDGAEALDMRVSKYQSVEGRRKHCPEKNCQPPQAHCRQTAYAVQVSSEPVRAHTNKKDLTHFTHLKCIHSRPKLDDRTSPGSVPSSSPRSAPRLPPPCPYVPNQHQLNKEPTANFTITSNRSPSASTAATVSNAASTITHASETITRHPETSGALHNASNTSQSASTPSTGATLMSSLTVSRKEKSNYTANPVQAKRKSAFKSRQCGGQTLPSRPIPKHTQAMETKSALMLPASKAINQQEEPTSREQRMVAVAPSPRQMPLIGPNAIMHNLTFGEHSSKESNGGDGIGACLLPALVGSVGNISPHRPSSAMFQNNNMGMQGVPFPRALLDGIPSGPKKSANMMQQPTQGNRTGGKPPLILHEQSQHHTAMLQSQNHGSQQTQNHVVSPPQVLRPAYPMSGLPRQMRFPLPYQVPNDIQWQRPPNEALMQQSQTTPNPFEKRPGYNPIVYPSQTTRGFPTPIFPQTSYNERMQFGRPPMNNFFCENATYRHN